ncbi:MAG: hypothetical protein KFH87_00640 [Bacteroidetes bacterium]|nr:hypothetical protein [Bacteroidota bacterium]
MKLQLCSSLAPSKRGEAGWCHFSGMNVIREPAISETGTTQIATVPDTEVVRIQTRVDAGRDLLDAIREVLTANAELFALSHTQHRVQSALGVERLIATAGSLGASECRALHDDVQHYFFTRPLHSSSR